MYRMSFRSVLTLLASVFAIQLSAATIDVNGFNVNGWGSWDTRDPTGTNLRGTNDSLPGNTGTYTAADDTQIGKQIVFMGEGQVVNDAAGGTPPASPSGSLGGLGYVRLDGTSSNSGKSDISYVNLSSGGIAPASALSDPSFAAAYTFYAQSNPTSREPGLNIEEIGTNSGDYILAFVAPTYTADAWNSITVDGTTSLFRLVGPGSPGTSDTIANWAADPTWGPILFGPGADVYRVGFNLGSGQRNGLVYLDSMSTTILNGGDTIDFQGVPEPSALVLSALALLGFLGYRWQRRRSSG